MRDSFLDYLVCPMGCGSGLQLSEPLRYANEIIDGRLGCQTCGRTWRVEEGIPRLLPDSLVMPDCIRSSDQPCEDPKSEIRNPKSNDASRKREEMRARDEQAADYDRMWYLNLFGFVEVPLTLLHMKLSRRHLLLEAGCGTGRMTRQFAERSGEMVSVDFSWESLRACKAKLAATGITNVQLAQADLCHLPFTTGCFDRVVSCQVLEHIPSEAARQSAVSELVRVLQTGGNLTLSAYQYSILMRLFGEKEGEHAGGIYFFRFTRDELRALLSPFVRVESMTGALVYHYIASCRK